MTKNPFERNSWGHEIWDDATKTLRANTKLWAEIEIMGAKLEKAEKVIETVDLLAGKSSGWRTRALRHLPEDWIAAMELIDSSLKEYRGETK